MNPLQTSKIALKSPDQKTGYLTGIFLIVAISLGIFYSVMRPPISDLGLMAELLAITAMISAAAGYMAYRFGWMDRSPAIRSTLIGGYLLSSLLTLLNVGVTAWLMFTSLHDLYLAMVLLVFAGGIAIVFGVYYTSALSNRIKNLDLIARDLAQGNLQARAPTSGRDEIAALGNTFNDMAQQLQAAAEKQRQIDLLRRDLIAWVGHDLRTPLASVRAVLEALADGVIEDPESVQRYLGTARRDINALSELIDDLFEMSQIDAGGLKLNREDSSLTDLISDTLESFSELAARQKVTLEGQAGPNLDPVWMDTLKIGRVLNNLVSNALTYTPPGGTVRLIAQRRSREIEVMVEDNGSGIAPQDLPTIFDRFTRGEKSRSRSTGGAGLGLAIARGIVEAHGGQIKVESAPGQATHFSFTIPNRQKDGTNR